MATVRRVTPILQVSNIEATVRFYQEVLGFTPYVTSPEYAYVEREGQGLRLVRVPDAVLQTVRGHNHIYIDVTGIAAFLGEVRSRALGSDITDLIVQHYGQMEFHISDPDGCLVMVGESTAAVQRNDGT